MPKKNTTKKNSLKHNLNKKTYTIIDDLKKSKIVKFLLNKKTILVTIYLVSILLILLNLYLTHKIRPYNSDDVAWQNMLLHWGPFNGNKLILGASDTFVFKLPFYILFDNLLNPIRRSLLIQSAFFSVASFSLFYFAIIKLMDLFKVKVSYLNLLPIVWFASAGIAISSMSLNLALRNIEMGLAFVLIYYVFLLLMEKVNLSKTIAKINLVLLTVLSGVLIYSDPYILFFCFLPLVLFATFLLISKTISIKTYSKSILILLTAIVLSWFFSLLIPKIGLTESSTLPISFVSYDKLFKNLALGFESVLVIFSANFFGQKVFSIGAVGALLNFSFLTLCLGLIFNHTRKVLRTNMSIHEKYILFFGFIPVFSFFVYVLSTMAENILTYRYFYMLFMSSVVFIVLLIEKIKSISLKLVISLLLIFAILANVTIAISGYKSSFLRPAKNLTNTENFQLIDLLKSQNLTKGYAGYWDSGINNYLSKGELTILPVACSKGNITASKWLVDTSRYDMPSKDSFIILDMSANSATCTADDLNNEYGTPTKIINIPEKYTIFVYSKDILMSN